jgi:hypothetical protein
MMQIINKNRQLTTLTEITRNQQKMGEGALVIEDLNLNQFKGKEVELQIAIGNKLHL